MITDKITIARAIKPAVPLAKSIYVKDDQIAEGVLDWLERRSST